MDGFTEHQEASMKRMFLRTLQEGSYLRAVKEDDELLQETVQLLVEREWLDSDAPFIHDERNFETDNAEAMIQLIVDAVQD